MKIPKGKNFKGPLKYWHNLFKNNCHKKSIISRAMYEIEQNAKWEKYESIWAYTNYCYECDIKCYWGVCNKYSTIIEIDEDEYGGENEIMLGFCNPEKHAGPFCKKCAVYAHIQSASLEW
jgi:hypothetical protein